jgi:uncharacterized membrane protein YtjA (UPF0391 family)
MKPRARFASVQSWNPQGRSALFAGANAAEAAQTGSIAMLGWAVTFLVIALIAAVLGFGGIAGFAVELAKIVFVVALILFVVSAVFGLIRGRSPTAL